MDPSFPLKSECKYERLICRFSLCSCPKLAVYIYAMCFSLSTDFRQRDHGFLLSSNDRDREEMKHTTAKRDEPGVEIE